jgi:hypothetical protein
MNFKRFAIPLLAGACLLTAFTGKAWAYEKCHKSKWGPNDQIGALNNITQDNIMAAAKLIKKGRAECIGAEQPVQVTAHDPPIRRGRPFAAPVQRQPGARAIGARGVAHVDFITADFVARRAIDRLRQRQPLLRLHHRGDRKSVV